MEIVIIGISNKDKQVVNRVASEIDGIEIMWNFEDLGLDGQEGILVFKNLFEIENIGLLVQNHLAPFNSISLIYEISEWSVEPKTMPKIFKLMSLFSNQSLGTFFLCFADMWSKKSLVRFERSSIASLEKRLNNPYVWAETYIELEYQTEIRSDEHPLILQVILNDEINCKA